MQHSAGFLNLVNSAKTRIKQCTAQDVMERMKRGDAFHLVDIREESEWDNGHVKGAVHIGRGILERDIEKKIPDHDGMIVLYCGGGFRSALSADALQQMGYRNVISMDGGWRSWRENDFPTEV
jgi:rhodanese-related sulfurtransferase